LLLTDSISYYLCDFVDGSGSTSSTHGQAYGGAAMAGRWS
jgi:hypothetical protein